MNVQSKREAGQTMSCEPSDPLQIPRRRFGVLDILVAAVLAFLFFLLAAALLPGAREDSKERHALGNLCDLAISIRLYHDGDMSYEAFLDAASSPVKGDWRWRPPLIPRSEYW